jgi:hypothetical protein
MGLTEKRIIKRLKEEVLPQREAELLEISGAPVRYEIEWDRFLDKAPALEGLEAWAFGVIADAFRLICRDEIGKEAVAEKIKTIQVVEWNSSWPTGGIDGAGTMSMYWDWGGSERFTAEQLEAYVSQQL